MKMNKLVMLMVSGGLAFSLMTGCGGGGGSDGDTSVPLPTPDTGMTPEKMNELAADIADEMGCTYTEVTTSQSTETDITLSVGTVGLIKKVMISGKTITEVAQAPTIAATQPGTCGGTIDIPDNLLDTMTGTITLTNYCLTEEGTGIDTTVNGSLAITGDEASGTITASTPTTLTIVSTTPETGAPINVSINLDSATLTINEDGSMNVTISALTVTDNVDNETYTVTNFTGSMSGDMLTFSGTFNNPQVTGAVNVVGSINATTGQGSITATDQNGEEVELSTTTTEGVFDVSFNDGPLGTMDCSTVAIPVI